MACLLRHKWLDALGSEFANVDIAYVVGGDVLAINRTVDSSSFPCAASGIKLDDGDKLEIISYDRFLSITRLPSFF